MSELWARSAFELGTSIRNGPVSSREVVEAHLARIEKVNSDVNAVTVSSLTKPCRLPTKPTLLSRGRNRQARCTACRSP